MKISAITGLGSIQDLGRFGQRSHGIGVSGAMDSWALQAGNALLGNPLDTPAIELTLGGITLTFEKDVMFCLTGAMLEASLDDIVISNGWQVLAKAGQTLKITRAVQGMHGYICVKNGFAIHKILGSASTNLKAEFGGLNGRLLAVGDTLPEIGNDLSDISDVLIGIDSYRESSFIQTNTDHIPIIRVMKNSEAQLFTDTALKQFVEHTWKLSSSSNRMGYRLEGDTNLELKKSVQMNSHGVAMGMIQVPPQGQPIVLMADTQTTGGYPKIATVIEADIGRFAQIRFGQKCQFRWVTFEAAIDARSRRQSYIARIQKMMNN